MSDDGLPMGMEALQQIATAAESLLKAVRQAQGSFASFSSPAATARHPLADVCNEFLLSKKLANRNGKYLWHCRYTFTRFAKGREKTDIAAITAVAIESWLHSRDCADRTKAGHLIDLRSLFSFALKRGYILANPALAVDPPTVQSVPPGIHTPEQVAKALRLARRHDINIMRHLAIRYFSGLRTSEALKMREADIKGDYIEVTAMNAKTRRRRLVTVSDNLKAWMAVGGVIPLTNANTRLQDFSQLLAKSGVPWPHNVTRHSFCSYHLARHKNAAMTALEAGHTEQMLFAHYREIVTPEAATAFWSIMPE